MQMATDKHVVWLIKDSAGTVSIAKPIKGVISAQRLVVFSSWREALTQPVKHSLPRLILIEGTPQANQIAEIRRRIPDAQLFGVTAYDDIQAVTSRASGGFSKLLPLSDHFLKDHYGLTPREVEILLLMVKGFIKKQIADQLSLSFHTVNNHERRVFGKLNVHSRSAAVAKALMEGLV